MPSERMTTFRAHLHKRKKEERAQRIDPDSQWRNQAAAHGGLGASFAVAALSASHREILSVRCGIDALNLAQTA
jgi:hypothetical protein